MINITNLYSNINSTNEIKNGDQGQAFYIFDGEETILMITGTLESLPFTNMKKLGIFPRTISKIIVSHSHSKIFSELTDLINADNFLLQLTKEPLEITDEVFTTGKIDKDPPHIIDDQSLFINTLEGLVVIIGCCNVEMLIDTLEHIKRLKKQPIKALIVGTYILNFVENKIKEIAKKLVKEFNNPVLYVCTNSLLNPQSPIADLLYEILGKNKVKFCTVGTELIFEL